MTTPRLIGVLDLLGGVVVRAVGGRRDEYRPVESRLCGLAAPLAVAAAFRDRYGIEDLYVADLDAILGRGRNDAVIAAFADAGFRVAVDAGVATPDAAARLLGCGAAEVVVGLESISGPDDLFPLVAGVDPGRLAFSLDLRGGLPIAEPAAWREAAWDAGSPLRIARRAYEAGFRKLVVLDLSAVGTGGGSATAELCRDLRAALPDVRIWTGGGLRTADEARSLAGIDGVLVASALHDGTW